mmetsp:Transcript_29641/g.38148  ORF Transcript_29641/g.38148 Transcript_29641/m.38148 type:complete len:83 (+) Transcript_29641:168-416(+)
MMDVTGKDVEELCETDNLCAGLKFGIEGGFHAMADLLKLPHITDSLLCVDTANALNSINRHLTLLGVRKAWPTRASMFLFDT